MITLKCFKCEYEWVPRTKQPLCCPECHSRNWNINGYIKCKVCKKNFTELDLHHKNKNHNDNRKENLMKLCKNCHTELHYGKNGKRRYAEKRLAKKAGEFLK